MKTVLARPGDLYIGRIEGEESVVIPDASAGWFVPRGLRHWEREVSVVARDHLTDAIRAELKATMPEEQIPPAKLPLAFHAASSSPFIAISSRLAPELIRLGVRVHTIGADAGSSSFFYFAEGGKGEPVRIQGEMLTLLSPTLKGDESTALLDQHLHHLIDRLLLQFTNRELSEIAVELAAALPRMNNDGTGLEDVDLDAFEKNAQEMMASGKGYEKAARQLSETLLGNLDASESEIPLFGSARREPQFEMIIEVEGKPVTLARRPRWIVRGEPQKPATSIKPSIPPADATPLVPMTTPKMAEPTPLMPPVSARPKVEPAKAPAPQPTPATAASKSASAALLSTAPGTPAAAAAAAKALEEAKRRAEEDVAKKRAEEAAAKKKADEEAAAAAAAKKKAEEEAAAAKKKAEEEAAAAAAAKKAEEEAAAAAKKADEEAAAAKKKAEEEAAAAAAAKKAEEEAAAAAKKAAAAKETAIEKEAPSKAEAADEPEAGKALEPAAKKGSGGTIAIFVVLLVIAAAAYYFLKVAK
ncbi:MAG: hypothetical protein U0174_00155 [Polyangiaceae bacterium]